MSLTSEDVLSELAGPELDALVAERVLGWVRGTIGPPEDLAAVWFPPQGGRRDSGNVPPFSTDIAAAWQVAEKLGLSIVRSEDGYYAIQAADVVHDYVRGTDVSKLSLIGREGQQWHPAQTAPLAICWAAPELTEAPHVQVQPPEPQLRAEAGRAMLPDWAKAHGGLAVALVAENAALRRQVAELEAELNKWRPLTEDEAQAAYEAAESVPISEEEIKRIVAFATNPANRLPNSDQAVLAATVRRLSRREEELEAERDRLAMELEGHRKANALLNAGMESACEDRDGLKQRARQARQAAFQEAAEMVEKAPLPAEWRSDNWQGVARVAVEETRHFLAAALEARAGGEEQVRRRHDV